MTEFDKKIRELSKDVEIPEHYNKRVDDILKTISEEEEPQIPHKKLFPKVAVAAAFCLICIICVLTVSTSNAEANIFSKFTQTIKNFLNIGGEGEAEKIGVGSNETNTKSKPDLMLELKETVIDSQTVYMLVKITAPADIQFEKEISFDYFAFSHGENFNSDQLISGATSCELLEVMEQKQNVATYVVSLSTEEELEEGEQITAYFKDLKLNPNGENPEMLVEGMWSLTFPVESTVTENIVIQGNEEMKFPFVNASATINKIKITPLGMTVEADVSEVPYEELGISDTSIALRLKMLDGTEKLVMSHNPEDTWIVDSGSNSYSEKEGKNIQKSKYEFSEKVDTKKIAGVYVEDLYVPVME